MSADRNAFALAAILVGAAILSRKAAAADGDVLQEIEITARRIGQGGFNLDNILSTLTNAVTPLGIRNNNPMNIRETAIHWQGELPHDGDGYEDFKTAGDGIRAGARVLINYYRLHQLNTVRGIVTRWAPEADNNPTDRYIAFVAARMNLAADAPLDMGNVENLTRLADAIIAFENGEQPYTLAFIRDAVRRAF